MDLSSGDIQHKQFRKRLMGLDPREVELFLQETAEEMQRLTYENSTLKRDLQERDKDLKEYKEREKAIRNVLLNAHKTVEQMKANAERESKLIISEAEVKAEKLVQAANQRLARLQGDIAELQRQRIQLETKIRSTLDSFRQLLDMGAEEDDDSDNKVKYLNR
ncbi:MAG: DivIVA domain-containing protein [Acidobacteriota bacterium]